VCAGASTRCSALRFTPGNLFWTYTGEWQAGPQTNCSTCPILTRYDLEEYRKAVAASGASGYVVKKTVLETLLPTIQEICAAEEKQRDNGRTQIRPRV
jgi:DNA-binding NarL/FixJ family response regulator